MAFSSSFYSLFPRPPSLQGLNTSGNGSHNVDVFILGRVCPRWLPRVLLLWAPMDEVCYVLLQMGERAVVFLVWSSRMAEGLAEAGHSVQQWVLPPSSNSPSMEQRESLILIASEHWPRDHSAATPRSWLCWKVLSLWRVWLKVPKGDPVFKLPQALQAIVLVLTNHTVPCPISLSQGTAWFGPRATFRSMPRLTLILLKLNTANGTAASVVGETPLDRQHCWFHPPRALRHTVDRSSSCV